MKNKAHAHRLNAPSKGEKKALLPSLGNTRSVLPVSRYTPSLVLPRFEIRSPVQSWRGRGFKGTRSGSYKDVSMRLKLLERTSGLLVLEDWVFDH